MTDYHSVKNTAKNGKLIRAEIRELVLAAAFIWGLENPKDLVKFMFPDNLKKQHQYTQMHIICCKEDSLQGMVLQVLKNYFNSYTLQADLPEHVFYDTKKLRIYRERLEYGRKKQWRLRKNTMQYLWTAAPLAYMFAYGKCEQNRLCFSRSYFIANAYDINENMQAVCEYITDICKIQCSCISENGESYVQFADEEWGKLLILVENETERLRKKFILGKYISETE